MLAERVQGAVRSQEHVQVARISFPAAVLLCACSHAKDPPALPPEDGVTPAGPCNAIVAKPVAKHGAHVGECSYIAYQTNPPSWGDHYDAWADFKEYGKPIANGYWVHSIEHGAVAMLWGCDGASAPCADMVAEARAFIAAQPQDPKCQPPDKARFLLLPYPTLGRAFAAVAWGHYLTADCFDGDLVGLFTQKYYNKNYEDSCDQGYDPSGKPASCGAKP